jgi:Flp pilus assembly protein TadD
MLGDRDEQTAVEASERRLGDFRLLREIGRGGMGSVWEAIQVSLDRRVAVKLHAAADAASPTSLARFLREATTIARLRHPGIVQVLASGADDGTPWIAMELIDGTPLRAVDPSTGLRRPPRDCAALVAAVARALGHAHAQGVVHRDVKPSNILLRSDGAPVLTDFGLARDESAPTLTIAGAAGGTPQYMAPEQIRGATAAPTADVFSLGVTLYELVTGVRPFDGPTTEATIHRVLRDEPLDPRRIETRLDADLAAIVLKSIEKDASRRYADGNAFAEDLDAWLAGRAVSARMPGAWRRLRVRMRTRPAASTAALAAILGIPLVATLVGYQIAKAPLVLEGERALREAYEEELWSTIVDAIRPDGDGDMLGPAAELERLGVDPAIVLAIRGIAWCEDRASPESLRRLDAGIERFGPRVALLRVRASMRRQLDLPPEAGAIGEPASHFEAFITGLDEFRRGQAFEDRSACRRAAGYFLDAVTRAPLAKAAYHEAWVRAASRSGDEAETRRALAALQALFGGSSTSQFSIAYALHDLDPDRAIALYRSIPETNRARWMCLRNIGMLHEHHGRFAEAETAYRDALAIAPNSALAWNSLGNLLLGRQRFAEAEPALRRALELRPTYIAARNNLGIVLRRTERAEEAVAELRRVTEARPDYARGHYNLGNALTQQRDFAGADAAFRAALRADPEYQRAANNLGNALKSLERYPEAIEAYSLAAKLAPKDVVPRHNLGVARRLSGDLEGAERDLRLAAQLDPAVALVWIELAEVQAARGDAEGAAASRAQADALAAKPKPADGALPRFEETPRFEATRR